MAQSKSGTDIKFDKFDGNTEEWLYWYERLKIALRNAGIKNDDKKRDLLLGNLGPQPFKVVFDHARPSPVSNLTFTDIVDILSKYYSKPTAPLSQRVKFSRRFRHEGESLSQFELGLRTLAGQCSFGDNFEERLRDQYVLGINSDRWQLEFFRLHSSTDTKLTDVIESALLLESVDAQQSQLHEPALQVRRIKSNEGLKTPTKQFFDKKRNNVLVLDTRRNCVRCGHLRHGRDGRCPAVGVECRACHGRDHFARACLKVGNATINKSRRAYNVHSPKSTSSRSSPGTHSDLDHINTIDTSGSKLMLPVSINGQQISMLYDPGAAYSIIGERLWKKIGSPRLQPTGNLTAYTGVAVETIGKTRVSVSAFGAQRKLKLIVAKKDDIPLFGLDWVLEFKLPLPPGAQLCTVQPPKTDMSNHSKLVQSLLNDFPDVFKTGLGTIKNCRVKFYMSPDAVPVVSKPRNVPFALRKAVEDELHRLVDSGVLEEVSPTEEPITWASPIVIVVKPSGAVRICADFKRTINKYMLPNRHPMPTFEEIATKFAGGNEFSVIDLKDAYLQMEVDPSVKQYLVIATHKGFLRYTRMPFGLKTATGTFQQKMDQILAGLDGVACLLEDIVVTGTSIDEHLLRVREVLRRLSEAGIRVQQAKCRWFQESVTYLGHTINRHGVHPSQEHVEALRKLPSPTSVHELRSFLGTVNYFSKFIPHLQTACVPLHELLRKGTKWTWGEEQERIVSRLRHILSTSDSLAHYDHSLPLILATDASDVGIGAALFHKYQDGTEKPVAFASRRLDSAEKRYSVVDKEALAVIFGVTRFNQYLFGRNFEIRTDQKSLVRLFGENDQIPKIVSNRISRWALTLSAYDYSIAHQKGKENKTADFLSRFPINTTTKTPEESQGTSGKAHLFHLRVEELPVSVKTLREETKRDTTLSKVVTHIRTAWPVNKKEIENNLSPFYCRRDELSFENGIVLWMGRIIIPTKLRRPVMDILHEGHPGISAMKSKARFQVWWPRLDSDLEDFVKNCTGCQENRPKDTESPLFSWAIPTEVWSRIHIDFAGPIFGKMWLIVVDARSKWLEVIPTNNTNSKTTINILEDLFSRYGLPRIIVSDNGPQLTSYEFQNFCSNLNIKHARITPYHPKSNGLAERCVRTFKERMKSSSADKVTLQERLNAFLLAYRTSPRRSTGKSPAQVMFGREIRTKLDLLKPDIDALIDTDLVRQRINHGEGREKIFQEDGDVWVLNTSGHGYKRGRIVKKNGPYSYLVDIDGVSRRCHADQLRSAPPA